MRVLIIALLVISAFAVKQKVTQSIMQTAEMNEQLQSSYLGRAIMGLVSLHEKLQYSLDDLQDAISQLRTNVEQKKQNEEEDFSKAETTHNGQVTYYQGKIDGYAQDLIDLDEGLVNLKESEKTLKGQLEQAKIDRTVAKQNLEDTKKAAKARGERYQKEVSDTNKAIKLLDKALRHLNRANKFNEKAEFTSFVEESGKEVEELSKDFEENLKQNQKGALLARSVAKILLSLSKGTQQNEGVIDEAIKILQELRADFENQLEKIEESFKTDSETLNNQKQAFQDEIEEITKTTIPKYKGLLDANDQAQKDNVGESKDAERNKKQEEENLKKENAAWDERVGINQKLIPQYERELQVIDKAVEILGWSQPVF